MRAAAVVCALAAALALVALGSAARDRARRFPVPASVDPSRPVASGAEPEALPACRTRIVADVGLRVTALLEASDGALWVGTFDGGLFRAPPAGAPLAVGLYGRERFVNALVEFQGRVWAGTAAGIILLDPSGRRIAVHEPETVVNAFARAGHHLYAGTIRGLFDVSERTGAEDVDLTGPDGERIRVTALVESGGLLWLGSARGVYSVPLAAFSRADPPRARWHPLAFGELPGDTGTVTALAPLPDGRGALAATDDGAIVRLGADGTTTALRVASREANEVSPGAAARWNEAIAFGTQGGGLLLARASGQSVHLARPERWPAPEVSALATAARGLFAGTAAGAVIAVACDPPPERATLGSEAPVLQHVALGDGADQLSMVVDDR